MSQRVTRRIGEVAKAIDSSPVRSSVRKAAFEQFRTTGVLPESRTVARAVLRQCKTGLDASEEEGMDKAGLLRHLIASDRPDDAIMDGLYREAVSDNALVRDIACTALQYLHAMGLDVTESLFAKSSTPQVFPDFGTVGLWVLGFPEVLVQPPYEEQARRLIDRYAELRARVPQGNRWWFKNLAVAVSQFREFGVVPEDELVRECVLADTELCELLRNLREAGALDMLALEDVAARAPRREEED